MARLRTQLGPSRLDGATVLRIAGIPIVIHPTWLILVAAIMFLGGSGVAQELFHNPTTLTSLLVGAGFAVIVSACILAHELAHSLVARAYDLRVHGITLFALGGVSQIESEAPKPRSEYFVALAGPLASVVIASCLAVVSRALNPGIDGLRGPWGAVAVVNAYLAIFNLIPAFPMDGGRILRSALWAGFGRRAMATRVAAYAGRAFALLLMALGGYSMVRATLDGRAGDGLWILMVGLFLFNAAGNAERNEGGDLPNRSEEETPSRETL